MIAPRVRIACPHCSRVHKARVEDLGKAGECKICGHRFRAGPSLATAPPEEFVAVLVGIPWSRDAGWVALASPASDGPSAGERSPSDGAIGSNRVAWACPESPFSLSRAFVDSSTTEAEDGDDAFHFPPRNQVVLYEEESPHSSDLDAWVDRLALQRDEARADCARLREENRVLRSFLAKLAEAPSQSRSISETREAAADGHEALGEETSRLRSLVVVLHLALAQAEAGRLVSDRVHRAAIDRLNAALNEAIDELESATAGNAASIRARRSPPVLPRRDRLPSLRPQASGGAPD